jgi:hypothetical protein
MPDHFPRLAPTSGALAPTVSVSLCPMAAAPKAVKEMGGGGEGQELYRNVCRFHPDPPTWLHTMRWGWRAAGFRHIMIAFCQRLVVSDVPAKSSQCTISHNLTPVSAVWSILPIPTEHAVQR